MKIVAIIISLFAVAASAQDYLWVQLGPIVQTNIPSSVRGVDFTDRDDRREYIERGLVPPPAFPTLVHIASGMMSIQPPTIRAGKREIQAMQEDSLSNSIPDRVLGYLTPGTNITALIGTNRQNYATLRYPNANGMSTANRLMYDRYCIEYLSARLQALEQLLADKGVVNARKTLNREVE